MSQSSNLFQKAYFTDMPFTAWFIIVGTLIVKVSYFMSWPYLVVILYRDYGATATEVGTMLAASALVGVVTGFYSGFLSDLLGRQKIIIAGCLISCVSYFGLSIASEVIHFYTLIMACGLTRAMIEEPSKALISDAVDNIEQRELAMNLRYFAINTGGALGPLIGVGLAATNAGLLFEITSVTYFIYALCFIFILRGLSEKREHSEEAPLRFGDVVKVIKNDAQFKILLLANVIMIFVYAHYSTTIPQIITRSGGVNAEYAIAMIMLINSLTIVFLQFPMLKILQRYALATRAKVGLSLMALSQVIYLAFPVSVELGWYLACFVLSLGEVIAFPTVNVQIDRLAPHNMKGSYFGAASLYTLGFALAPLVGGVIIDQLDPDWLFAMCLGLCLFSIYLYGKIHTDSRSTTKIQA